MKRYSKIFLPPILVLAVGLVFVYKYKNTETEPAPLKTETIKDEFLVYSENVDGASFSVKYPSDWAYATYSCNVDGVKFFPKELSSDTTKIGCGATMGGSDSDPRWDKAPIGYTGGDSLSPLRDEKYRSIYDQMSASLKVGKKILPDQASNRAPVVRKISIPTSLAIIDTSTIFPDNIGVFEISSRGSEKIRKDNRCVDFSKQPNAPADASGEVCIETMVAEYKDASTQKVVFVHLVKITKGKETAKKFIMSQSRPEIFNGFNIMRIEDHELSWFPKESFDEITLQEGTLVSDSNGSRMNYGKATGDNPVMKYFFEKYPPQN